MPQWSTHTKDTPAPASSRPPGEKQGKMPPHHRTFSLLGSASEIQRDPLAFLLRTQQLGEVVRLRFLFSPAYLVSDPESIKHVLQHNARNYNTALGTPTEALACLCVSLNAVILEALRSHKRPEADQISLC